jgi:hypothetical protein
MTNGSADEELIAECVSKLEVQWESINSMRERGDVSPEDLLNALSLLAIATEELRSLAASTALKSKPSPADKRCGHLRLVKS